ncbi:MAG: hypothetical protein V2B18_19825 [Pseudomonadota bacterium]
MPVALTRTFVAALLGLAFVSSALATGEDILALTGQYTFFIKPVPGSCTTYHQKMVPCVATKTIMASKPTTHRYPVPEPSLRSAPVCLSELPVGCADGVGPCLECFPRGSCRNDLKRVVMPRMTPVAVSEGLEPKCVTKRIRLPQWFAVEEAPKQPRKIRKTAPQG